MVDRSTRYGAEPSQVGDGLLLLLEDWDPYTLWMTIASGGVEAGEEFYYSCYNCTVYTAVNPNELKKEGYNIMVLWIEPQYAVMANTTITEDYEMIQGYANSPTSAQEIVTEIFENYCVFGVMTTKRLIGEHAVGPVFWRYGVFI